MSGRATEPGALETFIFQIRGSRLMLDEHLATIYGVSTKQLNQQVKRNLARFPADFAFRLTEREYEVIRSQNVTTSKRAKSSLPWAFTEHGAIMLASVLNSSIAVEASVRVVRAFVRVRQLLSEKKEFAAHLKEIERRLGAHDAAIAQLFAALRELLDPGEDKPDREIGFHVKDSGQLDLSSARRR